MRKILLLLMLLSSTIISIAQEHPSDIESTGLLIDSDFGHREYSGANTFEVI